MQPPKEPVDIAVVGGGPIGSFVALNLAKLNRKVLVFEEHKTIGAPAHCAGHLSILGLRNLGLYPLPSSIIENTFSQANFYSPSGFCFSIKLAKPVTCSVNREAFDKYIASMAETAVARYYLNAHVHSLMIDGGIVKGVNVTCDNAHQQFPAKIVIDAEGISCRLLRQTGLPGLASKSLVHGVEAEVENFKNQALDAVEVFLGKAYAPGFYAWLIPRRDGTAKVGLAAKKGNPQLFLQKLMQKHPVASRKLRNARIQRITFHPISLSGPVSKAYADGFLAVGDAASQVKPTTGGGVIFGLTCAGIAAEVADKALRIGDVSSTFLRLYQKRFNEALGFDFRVMLQMRRFIDSLSDEDLDALLRFYTRIGLDKALANIEEVDFQGKLLLGILNKPAMFASMAYLLKLYLSANP
ncbi:MAG: NAD(P)/FAD-dependent oxidoreductase [Candidatus Bathyarchaeota archaeon]|nr:NAD(P)/FAD-dependent oxidoreductase [Candidatus Bathyarchaeota archaeon]